MLTAGLVVFGLASLGAAFSGNPTQLIFCRVFMGAAEAMIMPSTLSTITTYSLKRKEARPSVSGPD